MRRSQPWLPALLLVAACDCDGARPVVTDGGGLDAAAGNDAGSRADGGTLGSDSGAPSPEFETELWYSVDDSLVRIVIDEVTGEPLDFVVSALSRSLERGQNGITMLEDGALLLSRLARSDDQTYFYYIADPPRDGSPASVVSLGVMPERIMVEGLYSDCDGRLYAMDTGVDDTNSEGNRLLRFAGDVLGGDLTYIVVSDLSSADVADIDDLGPGLSGNQVTDNPGLAIDTGVIYDFNYETGTGTEAASGGTWGIHVLGGDLFQDARSRLYLLSSDAELFEVDPTSFDVSSPLGTGPDTDTDSPPGWSGLAGPLTECETGFVLI